MPVAVVVCQSVRPSVCHKSVLQRWLCGARGRTGIRVPPPAAASELVLPEYQFESQIKANEISVSEPLQNRQHDRIYSTPSRERKREETRWWERGTDLQI